MSYVYNAAAEIAADIEPNTIVAVKSTASVITGDEVGHIIRNALTILGFDAASNPEFLHAGPVMAAAAFQSTPRHK